MSAPVKASGIDARYALPGLTFVLAFVALWLGTRRSGSMGDIKNPLLMHVMALAIVILAYWFGTQNPKIFDGVPILGKALGDG